MLKSGVLRDPVCGRRMNRNKAYAVVRHEGKEYLVCWPRCQSPTSVVALQAPAGDRGAEFEASPEAYVART